MGRGLARTSLWKTRAVCRAKAESMPVCQSSLLAASPSRCILHACCCWGSAGNAASSCASVVSGDQPNFRSWSLTECDSHAAHGKSKSSNKSDWLYTCMRRRLPSNRIRDWLDIIADVRKINDFIAYIEWIEKEDRYLFEEIQYFAPEHFDTQHYRWYYTWLRAHHGLEEEESQLRAEYVDSPLELPRWFTRRT